jgi:hypothetical protein
VVRASGRPSILKELSNEPSDGYTPEQALEVFETLGHPALLGASPGNGASRRNGAGTACTAD